ncbi:hypothetical protein GCM10020001_002330 [Nonomuraea salmonea]
MKAIEGGFELEYTQPLPAGSLEGRYQLTQWRYVPAVTYGGPKVDEEPLTVTSATVKGKKVTLKVAGLKPGRVVHLRSPRPFASASGEPLWSTEAWYTLNSLPGGASSETVYEAESAAQSGGAMLNTDHPSSSGAGFVDGYWTQGATTRFAVQVGAAGTYHVGLRYSNGPDPAPGTKSLSVYVNGTKVRQVPLPTTGTWDLWATRVEPLALKAGVNTIAYRYDSGDLGNVNLDAITVAARPVLEAERATLRGGATVGTARQGFTGTGYVDGYTAPGARTSFSVRAETAGTYNVGLRYAAEAGTSVSVHVNGRKIRQVRLAATGGRDAWEVQTDALPLRRGANTVTYRYDAGDGGGFGLDHVTVAKAERITLFDGSSLAAWERRSGGAATWPVAGGSMESYGGRHPHPARVRRLHAARRVVRAGLSARGDRAAARQQRRLPPGAVRGAGAGVVRRHHAGRRRSRLDLLQAGARPQHGDRARHVADVRHHVPRGPVHRRGRQGGRRAGDGRLERHGGARRRRRGRRHRRQHPGERGHRRHPPPGPRRPGREPPASATSGSNPSPDRTSRPARTDRAASAGRGVFCGPLPY